MEKIRTETLKKALGQTIFDTSKYRYVTRRNYDIHGNFAIIFRKRLIDLETTAPWEAVAISEDGKTIMRIKRT